jgi:hypothetical protein
MHLSQSNADKIRKYMHSEPLVSDNIGAVWGVIKRIRHEFPISISEDAMFIAGLLGLIKAVETFDFEGSDPLTEVVGIQMQLIEYLVVALQEIEASIRQRYLPG